MPHYVPVIKSKANDIDAIVRSSPVTRASIKPLMEPSISIEDGQVRTDLSKATDTILKHLPEIPFYFDPLGFEAEFRQIASIGRMAQEGRKVSPTFGVHRLPLNANVLKHILQTYSLPLGIRVELQDMGESPEISWSKIIEFSAKMEINPSSIELILDLRYVVPDRAKRISESVLNFITLPREHLRPRSITLIGSSAVASVSGIDIDGHSPVRRVERDVWLDVNFELDGMRFVQFGDYGVLNPDFVFSGPNPNANAKIRYSHGAFHQIFRGHGLYRPARFDQYHDLAKRVVNSKWFAGSAFSYGDSYVAACAAGLDGPGNLATWVKVDTNHHLELVSQQTKLLTAEIKTVVSPAQLMELQHS